MTKKLIGLYQLFTGVFGIIILVINYLGKDSEIANSQTISNQVATGVILYGLLAWAGYGLMNDYGKARAFSIFLQAIQIPILFTGTIIYKFTSAGFLSLGMSNTKFVINYTLQPVDFSILTNFGSDRIFMFYLVPLIFLIGLIRSK